MFTENGFENPFWFTGIVEDNRDPLNQGRVRVRIFGLHPPYDTGELPTSDLPWAVPLNGSYGGTTQIPRVTDWVMGFFPDGRDAQHPFLLGTVPGQNLMSMWGSGEPNESAYMRPSDEARRFYGASPLRPAQSGENLQETQLVLQEALRRDEIKVANDGKPELYTEMNKRGWSEPNSATSSNPAQTTIFSSTYGDSYVEVCGQEDNEFINVSHASGSQVQIDQNGDIKIRSIGDIYNIAEGNIREFSGARRDVTIEGKYTIKVTGGDCTLEVDGDLNHIVHGDYNLNVGGRMSASIGLGFEMAASRISMEAFSENINVFANVDIRVQCKEYLSLIADKKLMSKSGELIALEAEEIHFNTEDKSKPDVAALVQVDRPTTMSVAIDGNQAGIPVDNPKSSTTGGAGNPNAANSTDDTVQDVDIERDIPAPQKYDDGIGRTENKYADGVAGSGGDDQGGFGFGGDGFGGGFGGSTGSGSGKLINLPAEFYLGTDTLYYSHWNSRGWHGPGVAFMALKNQPIASVTINGVAMSKHGSLDKGRQPWAIYKVSNNLRSGKVVVTYTDGSKRSTTVVDNGITYGPHPSAGSFEGTE